MLSLLGSKLDVWFKNGSELSVTGMLQIGIVDHPTENSLRLDFDGDVQLTRDLDMVQNGAEALLDLGASFSIPTTDNIVTPAVMAKAWTQVYDQKEGEGTGETYQSY